MMNTTKMHCYVISYKVNDCITVDSFKELKIQYEGEPKIYVVEKDSRRYNSSESIYSYIFLLVLILLI